MPEITSPETKTKVTLLDFYLENEADCSTWEPIPSISDAITDVFQKIGSTSSTTILVADFPKASFSNLKSMLQKSPSKEISQKYFWTSKWQQGEKEADEDIAMDRTRRFSKVTDAVAWLHSDSG